MGAWVWEPVTDGLRALGHHVSPVTLSGLSKGADVSNVGLATHVNDVLSHMAANDLRDVVVVGHLYSGIVAGQVADRAPNRVAHTVFEVAGVVPEYALAARRYLGEEDATAYLLQVDQPGTTMARIAVHPTWVGVLDFQTRFPSALPQRFRS